MKKSWKRLLTGLTCLVLALTMSLPAFALESTPEIPHELPPDPWAYEYIADSYALGLVDDNMNMYIKNALTQESLDVMTAIASAKLALLELPQRTGEAEPLVLDLTRGGVMNALYQICAAYELPGIEEGAVPFLKRLGVVRGVDDQGTLELERACTYQEAMVMCDRLILAVYDGRDAGSKGLMWKATNGANTLYLLGTIHVDRSNVYPLHKTLRSALAEAQSVYLELDFNDQAGMLEFAAMQVYTDGTTLADHVGEELYTQTVSLFAALGMTEEQVAMYKPWALANTLTTVLSQDTSTIGAPMAIDLYVNAAAVNTGKAVAGIESYTLQGGIFDTLSPEYQEAYLGANVAMAMAALSGGGELTEEEQQAAQEAAALQTQQLDAMMAAWKNGDADALAQVYDKGAIITSDDELSARLFTDRDPNMLEFAAALLETEGENTYFMAVGAGHMLDPGGIVNALRELGYTVEEM